MNLEIGIPFEYLPSSVLKCDRIRLIKRYPNCRNIGINSGMAVVNAVPN